MTTLLLLALFSTPADTPLTSVRVASGLSLPVFATAPPQDLARLFIVEKNGKIKILKDGQLLGTPFLDVGAKIVTDLEQGLLGLAFHPDYAANGFFYVNYTRVPDGATVIARYQVAADPDVADQASELVVLAFDQPATYHNGGMIAFGPNDGYLYISTGDGGDGANAQSGASLSGKILRIDVDQGVPYANPPTNPYFGPGLPLDEIWAMGLRNPWRFSFDRLNGDLITGDVGLSDREEIDFQPASSTGGENYGWPCLEGTICWGFSCSCVNPPKTAPIHDYAHDQGCSVIGGYVYRGCAVPDLQGTYFFADWCTEKIWSFRYDGTTLSDFRDRTTELDPAGSQHIDSPTAFGEDGFGELYVVDGDHGELFKIVPVTPAARWANYGSGWPGTNGVPGLTASAAPEICETIDLVLGNSLGAGTQAILFAGFAPASTPTIYGGTLLVTPSFFRLLSLPAGVSSSLPVAIPCDASLCGVSAYLQALEVDPGASKGVSFTLGIELVLGPPRS